MLETAPFGRTGHESTRVIFGAAGLGGASQEEADAVLEVLVAHGVNHLDTAASYGEAELRMGPWMERRRDQFFLATKTGERTGQAARESLERSLERLRVDQVDLIQLHNLVEEDEWETAFGPGGAVEALAAAREEGLTRFVGVTGHGLRIAGMHLRSLERFDFDSVLFPYNSALLADTGYRADVERLIATCDERRTALQTIKGIARRRWQGDAGTGERRLSWYEPLSEPRPIGHAVDFVLSRPELFLVTSSDWRLLPSVLESASAFFSARPGSSARAGDPAGPSDLASPGDPANRAPAEEQLAADRAEYGIEPIFDGGQLERI